MTCESSRSTLEYVDQCPKTKSEWDKAAAKKDCMSIRQNCSSSGEFVFHCLINPWENATVEVCALRVNIIGNDLTILLQNIYIYKILYKTHTYFYSHGLFF